MKFLGLIVGILFTFTFAAQADDSSSGCGLGWAVTKRQSLLASSTRSIVNATFLNTVGMTLGTSGCTKHSIVMKEKEAIHFAEANYHNLMMEVAAGNGEYLENFASVMGCHSTKAFTNKMQSSFHKIYNGNATPVEVINRVGEEISSDSELVKSCSAVII